MNLNELSKSVHAANIKWWQDIETGQPIKRNRLELLALAISEVSECLEGERRNLMDDKLPNRKMAEVEMADAYIRLLDFSGGFKYELWEESLQGGVSDNKGEALFRIMEAISKISGTHVAHWISVSLAHIRDYCVKHGYDLDGAMAEKMAFNSKRSDHKHEARKIAGGKQF